MSRRARSLCGSGVLDWVGEGRAGREISRGEEGVGKGIGKGAWAYRSEIDSAGGSDDVMSSSENSESRQRRKVFC